MINILRSLTTIDDIVGRSVLTTERKWTIITFDIRWNSITFSIGETTYPWHSLQFSEFDFISGLFDSSLVFCTKTNRIGRTLLPKIEWTLAVLFCLCLSINFEQCNLNENKIIMRCHRRTNRCCFGCFLFQCKQLSLTCQATEHVRID